MMNMHFTHYLALTALMLLMACQPAAQPKQDAGDASVDLDGAAPMAVRACANLVRIGCIEGLNDSCVTTIERVQNARITDLHPACLADAMNKAEARACGSVQCP